ncbi:MAG: class IV adenylate cyclase [Candidatus Helarchaeota archaeon]
MIEVEIKVPISDKNKIIQKLKNIGFIFKKSVIQKDIYFQHPSRNFVKTDEALRIRETPEEVFLNYKGPKIDTTTKTREEIEISLKNGKNLIKIFEKLGFQKVILIEKKREIYELDEIKASVDMIKGLGDYLELEILLDNRKQLDTKRELLFSILDRLGISKDKIIRKSYLELLLKI